MANILIWFLPVRGDGLKFDFLLLRIVFEFLPVRGDGLKCFQRSSSLQGLVSPRKGRWIEMQIAKALPSVLTFLPVRGDGLKCTSNSSNRLSTVSPRKGRWIEIYEFKLRFRAFCFSP